jgi:RNA polymerase sigma-70 factor (ECF subfamily)
VSEGAIADRTDLLVQRKGEFLRFLERRLGSRADAEDLLQESLLKVVAHKAPLRDHKKLVPWFYQILRNLLVDHFRRGAALHRLKDHVAAGTDTTTEMDDELFQATYPCVNDVAATLKPEYGELIRRVELAGEPLHAVARDLGIKPNNASVRLHRARRALRQGLAAMCGACVEHACLDCSCRQGAPGLAPTDRGNR